ncbi:unnamed protein product [Blepharisma stoltei]|uniref:Uncharacterized protein n=1 Tax=Blepharisma stoltei TaxID=1481888 RepID=A0AAU9ISY9_9CILI|nr:unnamed protein product [Blepharisma stoltei]
MDRLSSKSALLKGAQVKMRCLTAGKTTNWRWNIRTLLFKDPELRTGSEIEALECFLSVKHKQGQSVPLPIHRKWQAKISMQGHKVPFLQPWLRSL